MTNSRQPASTPLVRLAGITKRYGSKVAVRDLSLELFPNEIFAFLGPNGAGKTTTMKVSVGLLRPDQGEVEVCGHDMLRDARIAKRSIAYVPDQPFLYDKLTGREFIQFARDVYGVPRDYADARFQELTDRLAMAGFLDQLTETYSHGMKQRVALAAALIHNPRVLVVDEPIVGLDPRTIRVIKTILREIADAGTAVFMSLHTLDIAEAVADRIGIIQHGNLIGLGTLEELRARARSSGRLEDIFLELTDDAPSAVPGAEAATPREDVA